MTTLTTQAETVAQSRYYLKNENNEVIETADDMFERVGIAISKIDTEYGRMDADASLTALDFIGMMKGLKFIPNSPTLMNAGTEQGTLSACFVLPLEDSNCLTICKSKDELYLSLCNLIKNYGKRLKI